MYVYICMCVCILIYFLCRTICKIFKWMEHIRFYFLVIYFEALTIWNVFKHNDTKRWSHWKFSWRGQKRNLDISASGAFYRFTSIFIKYAAALETEVMQKWSSAQTENVKGNPFVCHLWWNQKVWQIHPVPPRALQYLFPHKPEQCCATSSFFRSPRSKPR